jgi:hypothetical protein
MALAVRPRIDFNNRLSAIRAVCEDLGLPANQVPDQSASNSGRTYLRYINYCRAALSLPLYTSLDYGSFVSAINAIGAAAGTAKPEIVNAPFASSNATPPIVGSILSVTNGIWLNAAGATFTYQWLRDNVVIAGQTAATHTVVSGDQGGHELSCNVVATTGAGASTPSQSNYVVVP